LFRFSGGIESMMKLYVGNLSFRTTDDQLRSTFEQYGEVASASVVMDRETGRSRGFGFVEMPNEEEAKAAINALHGQQLEGRNLTVNEAKPREAGGGGRGGFGGGGGGRGGFGGGGGGGGGRGGFGGGGGGGGGRRGGGGGGGW
jgi:RNA recognition motif-containing protein